MPSPVRYQLLRAGHGHLPAVFTATSTLRSSVTSDIPLAVAILVADLSRDLATMFLHHHVETACPLHSCYGLRLQYEKFCMHFCVEAFFVQMTQMFSSPLCHPNSEQTTEGRIRDIMTSISLLQPQVCATYPRISSIGCGVRQRSNGKSA
jgi:hypothetical protein